MEFYRPMKNIEHCTMIAILLYLHLIWTSVLGRSCKPEYHSFTEYNKMVAVHNMQEFYHPGSTHYSKLVVDKVNKNLIVGARNYLFLIDGEKFTVKKNISWRISSSAQSCLDKGRIKEDCQNYVQLIIPFEDKLFICGTNSLQPVYNITKIDDPTEVLLGNQDGRERCSSKVNLEPVGAISRLGELIAATYRDRNGRQAVISGSYLDRKSTWDIIRTQSTRVNLNGPTFIASIAVYPSVFIFFNEIASERSNKPHATVARICQTDNGGSLHILENQWTTFRKTRLDCIVPGFEDMKFDIIEKMFYNEKTETFYGVFRTSRLSFKGSAMCSFDLAQLKGIFDGDFWYEGTSSSFRRIKNPNHFNECKVNPKRLRRYSEKDYNETVRPGKEPTNLMISAALTDSYRYKLMYNSAKAVQGMVFHRQMERFTAIVADISLGKNNEMNTLLYIATDIGTIMVLHLINTKKIICILDEIVLFKTGKEETIKHLVLWEEKQQMYVSTDSRVIKLHLGNCSRHKTKSSCVGARHPNCGWNVQTEECISVRNLTSELNVIQDLSMCPEKRGYWSPWSEWNTCLDTDNERNCRCRKRQCRTCKEKDCHGSSIDIKNCTAVKVKNETSWLKNGPVDGGWSKWSTWSTCDHDSCGSGFQTRERSCNNPSPEDGGLPCIGDVRQCQKCHVKSTVSPCIHKTVVGSWSSCICFLEDGRDVSFGMQFRVKTCFSSCKNKRGCPSDRIQNRTCMCNNIPKLTTKPGPIITAGEQSGTSNNPSAKNGFSLSDIIVSVVASIILCIVVCAVILVWTIRRQRKKSRRRRETFNNQEFTLRTVGRNGDVVTKDIEDEKRPLSSSSESSMENSKHISPEAVESPVASLTLQRTKKHHKSEKLKMFGENRDYDTGITSF